MFKKLIIAAVVCFAALAVKADDQKISSTIKKVVVFLNGAQITRTATVNVNAGTSTLIFQNISAGIDVQSIQVHANGEFTILSVKHEIDFLNEQAKQKRVEDLKDQQKSIKNKIDMQNNLYAIYQEEANMLVKNQAVGGQNTGVDIIKLKQALDFQTERLTVLKKKQQDVSEQLLVLNRELEKYNQQIADITRGTTTSTSNILVTVSSKTALQTEFTLSYLVNNASWFPTYDIRAKDVNSPISISYKASVSQQSGEDWRNIKLTLSTGNPSVSGSKPELNPYYLYYGMSYNANASSGPITRVTGKLIGSDNDQPIPGATVRIKGTSIGTVTDANGNYSIQLPNNAQLIVFSFVGYVTQQIPISSDIINVRLELPLSPDQAGNEKTENKLDELDGRKQTVAGHVMNQNAPRTFYYKGGAVGDGLITSKDQKTIPIEINKIENQTNIEFNIDNPYSVPSDGKQYTVEINQLDLAATYQYAVAPKLSTDVFLTAKLTDWNKYNFLSGEANLFFEGTFIGKSLLNTNATTDTLNLSLGADKNIVVTRTSLQNLTAKQSLGSNRKETRDWQIEIKNRKNQSVNLLVEDQVPVSQNSAIDVDIQQLSSGQLDKITGKVIWNMPLKVGDDKKLELKYQVKYPKNQPIIIE